MEEEEFRAKAKADISRLLDNWKTVELWIKRAEQINGSAMIPAINELRYASRQLFNAIHLYDKAPIAIEEREKIKKRIIISEQYLLNSEHDISDAVITYYKTVCIDLENRFGRNIITSHFAEYPLFRRHISDCENLISDSRQHYDNRSENYRHVRDDHILPMIEMHEALIDAEVSAQEETLRTERELKFAEGRASLLFYIAILSFPLAILGIALSVYLWIVTPEKYCIFHKKTPVLDLICSD
jgi:hypothetical protein